MHILRPHHSIRCAESKTLEVGHSCFNKPSVWFGCLPTFGNGHYDQLSSFGCRWTRISPHRAKFSRACFWPCNKLLRRWERVPGVPVSVVSGSLSGVESCEHLCEFPFPSAAECPLSFVLHSTCRRCCSHSGITQPLGTITAYRRGSPIYVGII